MSVKVVVPKAGFAVTEAELTEWKVAEGDSVNEGEIICCLEADKAVIEIGAPASGIIKNLVETDSTYEVGAILATIE